MGYDAPSASPEQAPEAQQSSLSIHALCQNMHSSFTSAFSKPDTASAYLPQGFEIVGHDTAFNPNHAPGRYDQSDIAFAKQHFDPVQVMQLEQQGPMSFNAQMDMIKHTAVQPTDGTPSQAETISDYKDSLALHRPSFEHSYPQAMAIATHTDAAPTAAANDVPFNPNHAPGEYNKDDIAYAKANFTPDEVRLMEKDGPLSFNAKMEMIRSTPEHPTDGTESRAETLSGIKASVDDELPSFLKHYGSVENHPQS